MPASLIDLSAIRVLCVDDDPVMRTLVREALAKRGCRSIVQAPNGADALARCAENTFDLLICDFHMAPMNGVAFLRALCEAGYGAGLPVIMLSAEVDPAAIASAQDMGISAWVAKPISVVRLLERIAAVLGPSGLRTNQADASPAAASDHYHTRLLGMIDTATATLAALPYQRVDPGRPGPNLQRILEQINELVGLLGYGLVGHLAERALVLLRPTVMRPGESPRYNPEVTAALSSILTAMRRVATKRIPGDGGVAGLKLLNAIDDSMAPITAERSARQPARAAE